MEYEKLHSLSSVGQINTKSTFIRAAEALKRRLLNHGLNEFFDFLLEITIINVIGVEILIPIFDTSINTLLKLFKGLLRVRFLSAARRYTCQGFEDFRIVSSNSVDLRDVI
jgi:hypothetical protein